MPPDANVKEDLLLEFQKLEPERIPLDRIFLDPNNPRFADEKLEHTSESRVTEDGTQKRTMERLRASDIGIEDLKESIRRLGFLTIDRVVVRPLKKANGFVVVEGNRRIAAVKTLIAEDRDGEITLDATVRSEMKDIDVLNYKGDRGDIAWIVQGIRHISSIRRWPKTQQAKFVVNLQEEKNLNVREVAKVLGLKGAEVTSLIRSHYAFRQLQDDEEFGDQIDHQKFAMLEEAVFRKDQLWKWLDWDDTERRFRNEANLKKFLSWITPSSNGAQVTRAIDVRDVIAPMVDPKDESFRDLLRDFEDGRRSLEDCRAEIIKRREDQERDGALATVPPIARELKRMHDRLSTLPVPLISQDTGATADVAASLRQIVEIANFQIRALDSVTKG